MSLINKIEYAIKHNSIFNSLYRNICSVGFRFLGLFYKTDENLVLFTGQTKRVNGSPKVIYDYMSSKGMTRKYHCVWGVDDVNAYKLPDNPDFVRMDSFQYFKTALRAKYWICSVNIERGLHFKKKNQIYLNTWHGAAINVSGNGVKGREDFNWAHIDFFCMCGKLDEVNFGRDMQLREKSYLRCGYPRNDILSQFSEEDREEIITRLNLPRDKKFILYAPTWRDSTDGGESYQLAPPVDFKKWEKELGKEYIVLFRAHPNTTKLMNVEFNEFLRDFTSHPEVNELLIVADLLISDYSSIILDYCITERPIICFGYDYDEYSRVRGFYYDLEKEMPNGVFRSEDKIISHIQTMDYANECDKTRNFRLNHCEYEKGNATETCISALFGLKS